jgi:OmpA-OmpF porin, OOP family
MDHIFSGKRFLVLITSALFLLMVVSLVSADPADVQGSSDHPLFTRMPGYYIGQYENNDFNSAEMDSGDGKTVTIEGKCTKIEYDINDGAKPASEVQIVRNYANAIQKIGGKIIYQQGYLVTVKITKNGAEIWGEISAHNSGCLYRLVVVEKQAMKQDVVADAASMAGSIKDTGKVALYGILFDTGKSEIKPESQAALQEIAKLLKNDSNLKLYVVGHTDNVGTLAINIKLSQDRAAAIVKALVSQYGINAARLTDFGAGPMAPAASNDTDDGRAQNRRVELVKQ